MPKNRRERRTRGSEKKDVKVIGKVRGQGNILLEIATDTRRCEVSGRKTNLLIVAGGTTIPVHRAYLHEGRNLAKRSFCSTAPL